MRSFKKKGPFSYASILSEHSTNPKRLQRNFHRTSRKKKPTVPFEKGTQKQTLEKLKLLVQQGEDSSAREGPTQGKA